MLEIKKKVGEEKLEGMILEGFQKKGTSEESKEDDRHSKRARLIIDGLEPKSKKAASKDFRSFLKTQKPDSKEAPSQEADLPKPKLSLGIQQL